jgi:two-component system nitrogen regulation sensor histidine kinase NtrY
MKSTSRWRLILAGILLTLLLAAVFTLGSLDVPLEPGNWAEISVLFALSTFITAALLVFLLILVRTVLRLWAERSKQQLGARFKTKMVIGAMAISLLPILFMFFVSYSLLNRTLARWFPRPLEIAAQETRSLLLDFGKVQLGRLNELAVAASAPVNSQGRPSRPARPELWPVHAISLGADAAWLVHADGSVSDVASHAFAASAGSELNPPSPSSLPIRSRQLPSGADVWLLGNQPYMASSIPVRRGPVALIVARRLPADFLARFANTEKQFRAYEEEKQHLRALKRQMLLILAMFTLLLFCAVLWMALFLAKQVTLPIQALAEGTREVSAGNFSYQVPEQSHDELGALVQSFNAMTLQLHDSRTQIDEFTRHLQQAVQELERRRQLMETILENIPTGVISLDAEGSVRRANPAMARIVGASVGNAQTLEELLDADAARQVHLLMKRALRMGVATREIDLKAQGRVLHAAVTVSSLGPRRANSGYVVVLDDLTEVLRSQKSAAWQEVARRIAHEIKNPLTPIQLSAQRLLRFLDRREAPSEEDSELARLVQECSRLIEREVGTLASLVSEFTQFVRFPTAKLAPTDANQVVREALEVFSGRLDGITLETALEENLPAIRGDGSLLRSVVVNLIDNAAESLETAKVREIRVSTRAHAENELIEISVEDTGYGISPEDKDRLFLPNFSTKDRGTGLGLTIAARIVAEHNGTIRVEDNFPIGSRFTITLPFLEHVPAAAAGRAGNGVNG